MKLLANLSSTHIMQEMEAICKRFFLLIQALFCLILL